MRVCVCTYVYVHVRFCDYVRLCICIGVCMSVDLYTFNIDEYTLAGLGFWLLLHRPLLAQW